MTPRPSPLDFPRVNPNGEPPLSPWKLWLVLVLALIVVAFAIFGVK